MHEKDSLKPIVRKNSTNQGKGKLVREGLFDWPSETPSLIGNRCRICGQIFFPKRFICPNCFQKGTLEEVNLSTKGKLYTFCILERGPMGFNSPYAVGYIDLPEGLRIYSILTETNPKRLQIGTDMELVIETIRNDEMGNEIIGYKFKPSKD